jgi:NAD+ kinase
MASDLGSAQVRASLVREVRTLGLILHPARDAADVVDTILRWAASRGVTVLGLPDEVDRLQCAAVSLPADELATRADLLIALGGDGTVLRAMRLSDGRHTAVLGVNLGKLGFLAEVDVPDVPSALDAIGRQDHQLEPRAALDAVIGPDRFSAFNDIVVVRVPGQGPADVALIVQGHHFVSYSADAVIVSTPTGSTAYNFSAGGPIVAPSLAGILVTPSAPHSVFNRSVVADRRHALALRVLPSSGHLAVEADGEVVTHVGPGATIDLSSRPAAAHVVRLGATTFYQRAKRKLGVAGAMELESPNEL